MVVHLVLLVPCSQCTAATAGLRVVGPGDHEAGPRLRQRLHSAAPDTCFILWPGTPGPVVNTDVLSQIVSGLSASLVFSES